MNADWAPGGRQPSDQKNRFGLWVRQKIGCYHPQSPLPFIIITQLVSWYSFYRPTEGGRLSRPRHCSKGWRTVEDVHSWRTARTRFWHYTGFAVLISRRGLIIGQVLLGSLLVLRRRRWWNINVVVNITGRQFRLADQRWVQLMSFILGAALN